MLHTSPRLLQRASPLARRAPLAACRAAQARCTRCSAVAKTQSHYAVLGLEEDASDEEVKRAFRRAARSLHPDVNQDDPQAAQKFMVVLAAYQALSDSKARTAYDLEMGSVSARAKDPRFARFERWRREVVPILEAQLADWEVEVGQIIDGWVNSLNTLDETFLETLTQARAALQPHLDARVHTHTQATQPVNTASPASSDTDTHDTSVSSDTGNDIEADTAEAAGPSSSSGGGAGSSGSVRFDDLQRYMQRLSEAEEQLQAAVQGGPQRMREYVEKRFEQVSYMFPAYPELVWEREWYDTSDAWLDRMELAVAPYKERAQRRIAEAGGLRTRHAELQRNMRTAR